ncbi:MAG: NnrU family protein [Pseudolabrys sp.]
MIPIWSPPIWMRHVTVGLMLISIVVLASFRIPSHIQAWTKHPMLASIKIWAFAHLLVNGDLGSILLFGSFLAWAVLARIAAKRRGDLGPRIAPTGWRNDIIVVVFGVVLYLLLGFYFHPYVIGMKVFSA